MFLGAEALVHMAGLATAAVHGAGPASAGRLSTLFGLLGLGGVARVRSRKLRETERQLEEEGRLRQELTAYLTLDLCPHRTERGESGGLLSRTMATGSSFARTAVLLCGPTGELSVAGSAGMDDLSVQALNRWAAEAATQLASGAEEMERGHRVGRCSFAVQLERRASRSQDVTVALGCARVHITPMRSGKVLLGALVVGAEGRPALGCSVTSEQRARWMEPMEALALRLTTQLAQAPEKKQRAVARQVERVREVSAEEHADQDRREMDGEGAPPAAGERKRMTMHKLLEVTHADRVVTLPQPSGAAMGFPPARVWHHGGSPLGLALVQEGSR